MNAGARHPMSSKARVRVAVSRQQPDKTPFLAFLTEEVEDKLSRHWTLRGEYRYSDFGTKTFTDVRPCSPSPSPTCGIATSLNVSCDLSLKTHTALVGLSYLFD